ncbi:short-chain dehydrogenase/reductase SDR [Halosimplex carlsbadense 2-9-1]|uniref:Short-chain dehydrogenase/reductase SDR n=1 Tax=Halosimplex carlsbadense 2-9-1 TaxID=797114 RepID=M0CG23_9EURY|nr:SDR family oxidoreductase [Halosimplex carlsbadense]ELZ22220.1 short-chain dehydrogenase/reductase SDR [Halosimplex carlsbadense 2-9-1]
MTPQLKPLDEQVMVITGATSGNGLATARMAADRGASLVLAARSEDALDQLTDEITEAGGDAVYVVADVSDRTQIEEIAAVAEDTYGGFDTWVNNAGKFVYGRLDETPIGDMRELFEVNVWGLLYGSLVAAEHLKQRGGGAIINVGSVVSERALVLQGAYSASKHAVKALTDTLRMELEEEGPPVSVTLVKPASIDTPYPEHAKNYTDSEVTLPPPVYAPETVARSVCHAAEHPERDIYVGGAAKNTAQMEHYAPGLFDRIMERFFVGLQTRDRPPRPRSDNAFDQPSGELRERGDHEGHVARRSLYTRAATSSLRGKSLVALGAAAALGYGVYRAMRGDEVDVAAVSSAERAVEDRSKLPSVRLGP